MAEVRQFLRKLDHNGCREATPRRSFYLRKLLQLRPWSRPPCKCRCRETQKLSRSFWAPPLRLSTGSRQFESLSPKSVCLARLQQIWNPIRYLSHNLKCEIVCENIVQKSFIFSEEEVLCNDRDIMPALVRKIERDSKLMGREFVRHIENPKRELLSCKVKLFQLLFFPTAGHFNVGYYSPSVVLMISIVSTVAFW